MNIPRKVKIGGITYEVKITENLYLGASEYSGEIDYKNLEIRIFPSKKDKVEADLLHETVHAILDHLGYTDHDEKKVDELSHALHMLIKDNPDMFNDCVEECASKRD